MTTLPGIDPTPMGGALPAKFDDLLAAIGLSSGLMLCLDAGDIESANSVAEAWYDRSGNGFHFWKGTGTGGSTADPTFVGTAGNVSANEYFSVDGGDYFVSSIANPTWVANMHKDNAQFTMASWVYLANVTTDAQTLWATYGRGSVATRGASIFIINADCHFNVDDGARIDCNRTGLVVGWNFICFSMNEAVGANGAHTRTNSGYSTFTSTYSSPSTAAASGALRLGVNTSGAFRISSGGRWGAQFGWDRALSVAETDTLFQATRGRYGV